MGSRICSFYARIGHPLFAGNGNARRGRGVVARRGVHDALSHCRLCRFLRTQNLCILLLALQLGQACCHRCSSRLESVAPALLAHASPREALQLPPPTTCRAGSRGSVRHEQVTEGGDMHVSTGPAWSGRGVGLASPRHGRPRSERRAGRRSGEGGRKGALRPRERARRVVDIYTCRVGGLRG